MAERVVLGGDVLTCERALGAQLAMDNEVSTYQQLRGAIYRAEGFHRVMNFVKVTANCPHKLSIFLLAMFVTSLFCIIDHKPFNFGNSKLELFYCRELKYLGVNKRFSADFLCCPFL